jgi:hypothetical protein
VVVVVAVVVMAEGVEVVVMVGRGHSVLVHLQSLTDVVVTVAAAEMTAARGGAAVTAVVILAVGVAKTLIRLKNPLQQILRPPRELPRALQ